MKSYITVNYCKLFLYRFSFEVIVTRKYPLILLKCLSKSYSSIEEGMKMKIYFLFPKEKKV